VDRTHGGDVAHWAESTGIKTSEILDFSASINPLGPPTGARKAFIASSGAISCYPDPYGDQLKKALARRHGMDPAEILIGNGSTQLIYLLCAAFRPRAALVVGPAFSEYANALALTGANIRMLPLGADEGFRFSTERLMAAWDKDCDIVFLATPNSVTGQLIPKAEIEKIAHVALTRKSMVVVDEAFIDFVEGESVKRNVRRNPNFIVLRSLTKYYGIPGLRLGYLLGDARRVEQLAVHQEPWSVNAPALNVALACLEDASFATKTNRWLEGEREFLFEQLAALEGLHPLPSKTNFLLVRIDKCGTDALELRTFLLRKKILIRACDSFGLGVNYFRVAVRRRQENRRLIAALAEWMAS
jgi:threonine-phosphate decarboxylase